MKILIDKKTVELALEALESGNWYINQLELIVYSDEDTGMHEEVAKMQSAITALRQALEQSTEQESVAAQCKFDNETTWGWCSVEHHNLVQSEPEKWPQYNTRLLYTQPQEAAPRQWVGLTVGETAEFVKTLERGNFLVAIQKIEAKLKEKNT